MSRQSFNVGDRVKYKEQEYEIVHIGISNNSYKYCLKKEVDEIVWCLGEAGVELVSSVNNKSKFGVGDRVSYQDNIWVVSAIYLDGFMYSYRLSKPENIVVGSVWCYNENDLSLEKV